MPQKKSYDSGRIPAIDAVRAVAIFAVVVIHSDPLTEARYSIGSVVLGDLIDFACRFAVPFFFITAAYFIGRRLQAQQEQVAVIRSFCLRLLSLIAAWYIVYIFWPTDWGKSFDQGLIRSAYWNATTLFSDPSKIMIGPRQHLWFLSALLFGILHVVFALMVASRWLVCLYSLVLYVFGLCQGPYRHLLDSELSLPHVPGWLLLPPLIIAMGLLAGKAQVSIRRGVAWGLFIFGTFTTLFEAFLLHAQYGISLSSHDFMIGTPFQALGLLFLAVVYPNWLEATPLPNWGRYTMGVYAAHVAVIELFDIRAAGTLAWELLKAPLAYALTLVLVIGLAKFNPLRRFLT